MKNLLGKEIIDDLIIAAPETDAYIREKCFAPHAQTPRAPGLQPRRAG